MQNAFRYSLTTNAWFPILPVCYSQRTGSVPFGFPCTLNKIKLENDWARLYEYCFIPRRWYVPSAQVDDIYIPSYEVLTLEASASLSLLTLEIWHLSACLIPNFSVSLPHPRSKTASFKTKLSFNDTNIHTLNSFCYLSHNRLHLRPKNIPSSLRIHGDPISFYQWSFRKILDEFPR